VQNVEDGTGLVMALFLQVTTKLNINVKSHS